MCMAVVVSAMFSLLEHIAYLLYCTGSVSVKADTIVLIKGKMLEKNRDVSSYMRTSFTNNFS